LRGEASPAPEGQPRGPGYAAVTVAALRFPPLRQAPAAAWGGGIEGSRIFAAWSSESAQASEHQVVGWGKITVAKEER
jgi:hypothetical protein